MRGPTALHVDNSGAVAIARDPMSTNALKHVRRRHFFVREMEENGDVRVLPVESAKNVADVLTKAMPTPKFAAFSRRLRGALMG